MHVRSPVLESGQRWECAAAIYHGIVEATYFPQLDAGVI